MTADDRGLARLDDHVVVITGASSGLGVQFARALDGAGARLVLAARRTDRLEELAATLRDAAVVRCDVADEAERDELVRHAVRRFGRLDGFVNNAGISDVAPALKQDAAAFRRVLEVNLVAPFALACDAARAMRDNGGGAIVNIASICSLQAMADTPQASYLASKAGLAGLTRDLAVQWTRYGIRVNALAPGTFASEMSGDSFERGPYAERLHQRIPMGREGRPGELDAALLLLLHPANSYMTGQTVVVDGGVTIS